MKFDGMPVRKTIFCLSIIFICLAAPNGANSGNDTFKGDTSAIPASFQSIVPAIRAPVSCSVPPECDIEGFEKKSRAKKPTEAEIAEFTRRFMECNLPPSCGKDISLKEAKASYEIFISDRRFAQTTKIRAATERPCACSDSQVIGGTCVWAPAEMIDDQVNVVRLLIDRLKKGTPFDKVPVSEAGGLVAGAKVIVESDNSTDTERHIALCYVELVDDAIGPPHKCVTVAIITPAETWLRAGHPNSCPTSGSADFAGGIIIQFKVNGKSDRRVFRETLSETLRKAYGFKVEQVSDEQNQMVLVNAAKSMGKSAILKGWNDSIGLVVGLMPDTSGTQIWGKASAMVCKQALGADPHYHGLTDKQKATYASVLDSVIENAIKSACVSYQKQDDRTIICK